jgi:UDP-glucose 4-epimerase
VTGAAGFIGSHLSEVLLAKGAEVIAVDCFTSFYQRSAKQLNLAKIISHPRCRFVDGDLSEADVSDLLTGVDYVFHLAAQPGVRSSWGAAFDGYVRNNVLATQRLLEAARNYPIAKLVYASSSSIYGDAETLPTPETVTPLPVSPYGVTKLAAEHLCWLYWRRFGVPAVTLRYFTAYGPRQRPDMAFDTFIRAALEGRPIEVFGDGEQSREFTYVDDIVEANLLAAAKAPAGRIYNVGGGAQATVNEVVGMLGRLIGESVSTIRKEETPGEARHTAADTTLARTELGYRPRVGLEEGLGHQIRWVSELVRSSRHDPSETKGAGAGGNRAVAEVPQAVRARPRARMMRIAYICSDFGVPVFGTKGASVHVRETVRALRGLGHTVAAFAPSLGKREDNPQRDYTPLPLDGFAARTLNLLAQEPVGRSNHLTKEWRSLLYAEYAQKLLLPLLRDFQPDIIYERHSLFAYAGIELARQLGVPLILEVNAPLALEQSKYRELVLEHTAAELEGLILRSADALVVVSEPLADYARQKGVADGKITVLPNGVDPERFHPAISGNGVKSRFNLSNRPVLGFVGSLKPWHDLDTLLAAVTLLAKSDGGVQLLVVGDGPRMDQLRGLRADHITCTGDIEHDLTPQFLAAMDIVAIPYSAEGDPYFSPLKMYEAMAMAKPIVGARLGQVAEVLKDGESGVLYEPGDAEDLAGKITRILRRPDGGAALGTAARRQVLADRTWEHGARSITGLAEGLLNGSAIRT